MRPFSSIKFEMFHRLCVIHAIASIIIERNIFRFYLKSFFKRNNFFFVILNVHPFDEWWSKWGRFCQKRIYGWVELIEVPPSHSTQIRRTHSILVSFIMFVNAVPIINGVTTLFSSFFVFFLLRFHLHFDVQKEWYAGICTKPHFISSQWMIHIWK